MYQVPIVSASCCCFHPAGVFGRSHTLMSTLSECRDTIHEHSEQELKGEVSRRIVPRTVFFIFW